MPTPLHVLHVEDSEGDAAIILRLLEKADYDVHSERVEDAGTMCAALNGKIWDVVICDYRLPGFDASAALALFKQTGLDIPFIVVSGTIGEDIAVGIMKAGADDYLMKDNLARLAPAVERELRQAAIRRERRRMEQEREKLVLELQAALAQVKLLSGFLPICAGCKKIRDTENNWRPVETYIMAHSEAKFSHGYCPDCLRRYFPGMDQSDNP